MLLITEKDVKGIFCYDSYPIKLRTSTNYVLFNRKYSLLHLYLRKTSVSYIDKGESDIYLMILQYYKCNKTYFFTSHQQDCDKCTLFDSQKIVILP